MDLALNNPQRLICIKPNQPSSQLKGVLCMTLNCIRCTSSGKLRSMVYPFTAITSRSTLILSANTC